MPVVQNGHTYNNNSAAFAAELLSCVWPFEDIGLERVKEDIGVKQCNLLKKKIEVKYFGYWEFFSDLTIHQQYTQQWPLSPLLSLIDFRSLYYGFTVIPGFIAN